MDSFKEYVSATAAIFPSLFLLIAFIVFVFLFKDEIKSRLRTLGNFKIAGATIEFHDQKETIRSYVLLAETLIDMLSISEEQSEKIGESISAAQTEKLGNFALEYMGNLPQEKWNQELLKNIALLLLRKNRNEQAIDVCSKLLKHRPNFIGCQNVKGLALLTSRITVNVRKAEDLYADLAARFPELPFARLNLALAYSLLEKHELAISEMKKLVEIDVNKQYVGFPFSDVLFFKTRDSRPDLMEELGRYIQSRESTE